MAQVNMYNIFIIIKKELRTTHEILAIMLAFEVEEITRIVARNLILQKDYKNCVVLR